MINQITTPCIGICSTVYGDDVCRGCKRRVQEVIDWNGYDSAQRAQIFARLQKQIDKIVKLHLKIVDSSLLAVKVQENAIRLYGGESDLTQAYYLLRQLFNKKININEYGLRTTNSALLAQELFNAIDRDILLLASKEYLRDCYGS